MSLEDTLNRMRANRDIVREAAAATPAPEPEGPPPDILGDPLIGEAMRIFGAEVESWGGTPPTPEGWKNIHPGPTL